MWSELSYTDLDISWVSEEHAQPVNPYAPASSGRETIL